MKILFVALSLCLVSSPFSYAKEGKNKNAFKECQQIVNIKKGVKPSAEEQQKMKACLKEKGVDEKKIHQHKRKFQKQAKKQARKDCLKELGITKPQKGQKMDEAKKAKLRKCIMDKTKK